MSWCAKFESRVTHRRAAGWPTAEGHHGAGSKRFSIGRFWRWAPAVGVD